MIRRFFQACYPVLLLLAVWEAVARSGAVPRTLLPPASLVIQRTAAALTNDAFLSDLATTLYRLLAGLALAVLFGIALGVLGRRRAAAARCSSRWCGCWRRCRRSRCFRCCC